MQVSDKILTMDISAVKLPDFLKKYYRPVFHIFLVGTIYTFWIAYVYKSITTWGAFAQIFSYASTYVLIVYFNIYFLFNRFFLKGRLGMYLITTLASFFAGCLVLMRIYSPSWSEFFQSFTRTAFFVEMLILGIKCITFSGLGITYRLFDMWVEGERKITMLANANLKAELDNLKSQVSPHFLFNTLNNLYVLTKTKPALASQTVLELSDMMRYQLNECNQERVPLRRELEYIRSLLALELLRKEKWDVAIHFPEKPADNIHIEPFLFITLIENAIKHGLQQAETGSIKVTLQLSADTLVFNIVNTKPGRSPATMNGTTHIGLQNLGRRLELLYPQRHRLELIDKGNEYIATLTLNL